MAMTDNVSARFKDLAERSYRSGIYTHSSFLTLQEQEQFYLMKKELEYASGELIGGHPECERRLLRFGSPQTLGYEERPPIRILLVKPLMEKFSDELTHRDFLGAVLNLGLERDTIGDIFVKPGGSVIFCMDSVSETILTELTRIKHTTVTVKEISDDELEAAGFGPEFVTLRESIASLRIDCIVAKVCGLSRGTAQELFTREYVTLNGRIQLKCDTELKPGDVLSVRGHGKFIFDGIDGTSKKGRLWANVRKYK